MQIKRYLLAIFFFLATGATAQAHLMVAQQGTLNIVDDGIYMVLSLPVSAFSGIDNDGDGKMSGQEFIQHRSIISSTIKHNVVLLSDQSAFTLNELLVSPTVPDDSPTDPSTQLVAVGKFMTDDTHAPLSFKNTLFGNAKHEKSFQITVSDKSINRKQLLVLTPEHNDRSIFPALSSVFVDYVKIGTEHIISGLDHLLFLLLVLAAGWHWKRVLLMLSTFTVGHAVTLAVSVLGGVSLPSIIVEPAILATILLMAAFDFTSSRRQSPVSTTKRLLVVFVCSLIHGLGLATALTDFGIDSQHKIISLAGFNVGIELGQLAVAIVAAIFVYGITCARRVFAKPLSNKAL